MALAGSAAFGPRRVLNVGSGGQELNDWVEQGFQVVTLDISPDAKPDIVADMCAMGEIGEFDAVFCCHALEHLYPEQVESAMAEFHRVLKPGGAVVILVPDLEGVKPDLTPLDEMGMTGAHLYCGNPGPHMAHHCGFVAEMLREALAMFDDVRVKRMAGHNLIGTGKKNA